MRLVIASGYFDPLHEGHLAYLRAAKVLGDKLIVVVNNDWQAVLKKGTAYITAENRYQIIDSLSFVWFTFLSVDKERHICGTLARIYLGMQEMFDKPEIIFANGGDVLSCAEAEFCRNIGIHCIYGVGGEKINSSSRLCRGGVE